MPFYTPSSSHIDGTMVTTDQWNADIADNLAALGAAYGARLIADSNLALLSGSGNAAFMVAANNAVSWYVNGPQYSIQFQADVLPANIVLNNVVASTPSAMLYFRYPGKYLIEAEAYFGPNATGYRMLQLSRSWPAPIKSCFDTDGGHATEQTILHAATVLSVSMALNQTQSLQVLLTQNSGATLSVGGRVGVQYLGD